MGNSENTVPAMTGLGLGSSPGPRHPRKARAQAGISNRRPGVPGWEHLRHGGLLLDATRLAALSRHVPGPLDDRIGRQLRQRAGAISEADADSATISSFVAFVLEEVCGLDASTGAWTRGNNVSPSWGRRAITGETVKPRHVWTGTNGARLPVFLDGGRRLGVGRGRRIVSQVLGWLRAGNDHLALVTNGRQWRLLFAGLDYDAWCEWDLDLWFEEGALSPQVTALRTLLGPGLWTPETEDAAAPLLQAIRDTRKGQAELSEVLGERVREAVEILIRGHGEALSALAGVTEAGAADYRGADLEDVAGVSSAEAPSDDDETFPGATPQDIYRAACRVAMRLVVILFAESRELLPRDNTLYHESYGLNGLLERLERAATRGGALATSFGAWPRVLALFRLVRDGSHHPNLPVTAYGGDLFAAGMSDAPDGLSRALHVFENACFEGDVGDVLPDGDVHEMLKLLTRTSIRIRQGRGGTRAVVPVDFSDLSSEYIGILYEGLLDYELKTAPRGDPVIFLSVGDQPALPLSRLEAMEDRALKTLFERLKESVSAGDDAPEGGDAGEPSDEAAEPALEAGTEPPGRGGADLFDGPEEHDGEAEGEALPFGVREPTPEYLAGGADERQHSRTRAETWARHAAQIAGLVRKPRGRETPERRLEFEKRLGVKARQLVARVVLPGEWYLVRWGGNRKGSGSFYTRPGLAVPTVQRTLRPLACDPPAGPDGTPDVDAPPARWTPKRPEEILALTVCDPACGSGTFPLSALRFLTDALYASLQHHGCIEPDGERALVRLLGLRGNGAVGEEAREGSLSHGDGEGEGSGVPTEFGLGDELIPCPPDDDRFEPRLKAVLRRHVVERCIYAVDLDPLAVELCRLSLWIETMDRTLPFGFLDHKVKCGNALIGAWFDQFRHYPVMAWKNREGGDKNHTNGVHFKQGARTRAIKDFVRNRELHDRWRQARARSTGFGDPVHPFRHQGSADLNLYKLFLEAAHTLLRPGGRLGFVVPSGLYSDNGTGALRRLFIERCRWEWLFGIENRDKVFPIDSRFKFNPVIVSKGGATDAIRTAFMRRKLDDWESAENFATAYTREQVERFSPRSRAILEIQSGRDLEILEKIYANAVLLGDDGPDGWGIRYAAEFHMTNDSRLFPPRPQWEAKGYRPDEYSRWLLGDWRPIEALWEELGVDPSRPEPAGIELEEWLFDTTAGPERREAEARFVHGHLLKPGDVARTDWRERCAQPPCDGLPIRRAKIPPGVILSRDGDAWVREGDVQDAALPLYQGIMIQPFVPSARGWISGTGLRAKWDYGSLGNLRWNPQYLMGAEIVAQGRRTLSQVKVGYRDVARNTDVRSFIGAVLPSFPCSNKVPTLHLGNGTFDPIVNAMALLNSFAFDWIIRRRLGAATLNWYVLAEAVLPRSSDVGGLSTIVKRLNLFPKPFAAVTATRRTGTLDALHLGERLRLRSMADAITCAVFGFDAADLIHVLRDSDLPAGGVGPRSRHSTSLDPRGFWRVDRDKDPELRHTVLTLIAFHDLESKIEDAGGDREKGIEAFLAQNHGEGWMLPETLRLADYGLGHDDRARHPQPVASRLGPRFHDWQLVRSADESWRECHLHARNLLGSHEYAHLLAERIERRAADGEDHVGTLTDGFTRELFGDDGYGTVLFEIRSRNVVDEDAYWPLLAALRDGGYLDEPACARLLDKLHARGLPDDVGDRRRRGRNPPAPAAEPLARVAEPRTDYRAATPPRDRQTDLFE